MRALVGAFGNRLIVPLSIASYSGQYGRLTVMVASALTPRRDHCRAQSTAVRVSSFITVFADRLIEVISKHGSEKSIRDS